MFSWVEGREEMTGSQEMRSCNFTLSSQDQSGFQALSLELLLLRPVSLHVPLLRSLNMSPNPCIWAVFNLDLEIHEF